MGKAAPGIVAVESISIFLYLIPLVMCLYWLITRFKRMKISRRIFFVLILLFSIVRVIHISLSFVRAEGAYPFTEKKYFRRNTNLIIWTAVLGVYLLYSAIVVIVYDWAKLLTRANLESANRVKIIAIVVVALFNLQYFILLTVQASTSHSTEAVAYASVCIVSIITLIPSLYYYIKLVKTLKGTTSHYSDKHSRAIKMLGLIIQPITLSLLLRSAFALAVAIKGSSTFLNFYIWIILFWMLPELFPVSILLYVLNPATKDSRKVSSSLPTTEFRTTSTTQLNSAITSSSRVSKVDDSVNV